MSGPNKPEFLDDDVAKAFAEAMFANEEPVDVDKEPNEEDGDQPHQTILEEGTDV